jgi:putative heme-binding domain-containing protein
VNHFRNHEGQIDTSNGRIYRLKARAARSVPPFDLRKLPTSELVGLLEHKNQWFRQTALRLLNERQDKSAVPLLTAKIRESTGQLALESLWALYLSGGFDDDIAGRLLDHSDPFVRLWTVRLLGDRRELSQGIAHRLAQLAEGEPNLETRTQLASTARRLPARQALPVVGALLAHNEDVSDSRIPLLLWWAIESKCENDREAVLELFADTNLWNRPLVREHILQRIMRRYAMAGSRQDLSVCVKLFQLSPSAEHSARLLAGFEEAFRGRSMAGLPADLNESLAQAGGGSIPLGLRRGEPDSVAKALEIIKSQAAKTPDRLRYIQILGEVKQPQAVPALLNLLRNPQDEDLHKAVLVTLQQYQAPEIGATVLSCFSTLHNDAQTAAMTLLASRPTWSTQLLEAVEQGRVDKTAVPQDAIARIKHYQEPPVAALWKKLWGQARNPTTAEMQQRMDRLAEWVRSGSGTPYEGQKLFRAACATCHKLFTEGGQVGPDLTTFRRDDLDNMLLSIVNPNAEIREGYENYHLTTKDGRTLSGFLADKDNRVVVLRGIDGENLTLPQDQIEEMKPAGLSLMPEGLLDSFNEQQVRDLFAYLRSTQPLVR